MTINCQNRFPLRSKIIVEMDMGFCSLGEMGKWGVVCVSGGVCGVWGVGGGGGGLWCVDESFICTARSTDPSDS